MTPRDSPDAEVLPPAEVFDELALWQASDRTRVLHLVLNRIHAQLECRLRLSAVQDSRPYKQVSVLPIAGQPGLVESRIARIVRRSVKTLIVNCLLTLQDTRGISGIVSAYRLAMFFMQTWLQTQTLFS